MQEATFLILTALAARSQHGYGIMTNVRGDLRRAGAAAPGDFVFGARPAARGELVVADRDEIIDGRAAPVLPADPGRGAVLAAEAARLQADAGAALSRLRAGAAARRPGLAGGAA